MSGHIVVDLSRDPADQKLTAVLMEAGSRGLLDGIPQGAGRRLTLGEAGTLFPYKNSMQTVGPLGTITDESSCAAAMDSF